MSGSPGPIPGPEPRGARTALVIATAVYEDPELGRLRAPGRDAADMAEVLGRADIGAFAVTAVVDRAEREIRRAVDAFLSERGVDDLVVVYLSCHGLLDASNRLYFAAADTVKARPGSTAVESTWLLDRLEDCRARRQVLILDCCFSGAFEGVKGDAGVELDRRLIGPGRGRAVLTASRAGEFSYEGTALPGAVARSVFTAGLVDGLRGGGADRDRDGYVSVEDAFVYAADYVVANGGKQRPQRWLYGGEGEIVLARNPHSPAPAPEPKPAPLPEALRLSLESPFPTVRRGAVEALGDWLASRDPGEVLAAEQALGRMAAHDSPAVAATARQLLDKRSSAARTEPPSAEQSRIDVPDRTVPDIAVPDITAGGSPSRLFAVARPVRIITRVQGFLGMVYRLEFSPSEQLLAVGGNSAIFRLYDPDTGKRSHPTITGHTGPVHAVAFSPDGRLLATGSDDKTVRLWDLTTGDAVGPPLTGHTGSVHAVAFSSDGRLLATGSDDKTVQLWDSATGDAVGPPLTGHTGPVHAVAFSPDGRLLATGSLDGTVQSWNPVSLEPAGSTFTVIPAPLYGIRAFAFSPDRRLLAVGDGDNNVRLWDPVTGDAVDSTLIGHTGPVHAVAFSSDGRLLATGSDDKTIRLWDSATGRLVCPALTGHRRAVYSVAFSPDGQLLATGGFDNTVRLWTVTIKEHLGSVKSAPPSL